VARAIVSYLSAHCTVNYDTVPIYEFECQKCGARFEELVPAGETAPCPQCKSSEVKRLYSRIGEPRVPVGLFGKAAAKSNSERSAREERRREKFAEDRKKRGR
jgi:putative FmdB family regulatory protein